jgi:hypothetical protein
VSVSFGSFLVVDGACSELERGCLDFVLGWSMKPLERVGSHMTLTFFQSLWYMESVLAEPYLWCSCE